MNDKNKKKIIELTKKIKKLKEEKEGLSEYSKKINNLKKYDGNSKARKDKK